MWIVKNSTEIDVQATVGDPSAWFGNGSIRFRTTVYNNPSIVLNGIGFDYRKRLIFMSDPGTRAIIRRKLAYGKKPPKTKLFHLDVTPGVGQLAVDWIAKNVYWVDALYDWIAVRSYARSARKYTRVIIETELDRPEGIAVHPLEG